MLFEEEEEYLDGFSWVVGGCYCCGREIPYLVDAPEIIHRPEGKGTFGKLFLFQRVHLSSVLIVHGAGETWAIFLANPTTIMFASHAACL